MDRETELVRFGARDYEPRAGRWTAKDPAATATESNLYAYCNSAPLALHDSEGLSPKIATESRPSSLSPDFLRRSAACTGRKIANSFSSPGEWIYYYIGMVNTGRAFDVRHNSYGAQLTGEEAKALGNELAGILGHALGVPWPVLINGARGAHFYQAAKNRVLWKAVKKAVRQGALDEPGDREEERAGYDKYDALGAQCGCDR
jgi:uncharacterized protein RhaS with RHS repeats